MRLSLTHVVTTEYAVELDEHDTAVVVCYADLYDLSLQEAYEALYKHGELSFYIEDSNIYSQNNKTYDYSIDDELPFCRDKEVVKNIVKVATASGRK